MADKKTKGKSVTYAQKEALVDFLENNVQLKKGKFNSQFSHKDAQHLWEQITSHLNSMIGAKKTADKWRKCWTDMKCNAKTKSVDLKKNLRKTGGGSANPDELDCSLAPLEEKIAGLIGDVPIFGQPNTVEPSITFEGYSIVMDSTDNVLLSTELLPPEMQSSSNDFYYKDMEMQTTNELMHKDIEISEENPMISTMVKSHQKNEDGIKFTSKKSKLNILQESVNASIQVGNTIDERNTILRDYYSKKLVLLERIAIAKEKKVAIMEKKMNMQINSD